MLYRVEQSRDVVAVEATTFQDESLYEEQVEAWIAQRPEMLGERLLIIGRQVALDGGKDRIDLLALDEEGSIVTVEVKRDLIGGDADLQALRYAALVADWSDVEIRRQAEGYWESIGEERDFLDEIQGLCGEEITLNAGQRVILAGRDIKPRLGTMALWLIKHELDVRVVAIELLKDDERMYLQPQVVIPPPAEPRAPLGPGPSKKPWLLDGQSWHLERCQPEGQAILQRVASLIAQAVPNAQGPSWSQKLYVSWASEGRAWAFLYSGAKRARLDLKKFGIEAGEAAERLGYSVFDEQADLKDKFALGSSVGRQGDGLRITIKSEDDLGGEKGEALVHLLRDSWQALTGQPPGSA